MSMQHLRNLLFLSLFLIPFQNHKMKFVINTPNCADPSPPPPTTNNNNNNNNNKAKTLFWGYNQFGLYILITIYLVSVIFNLQSIWSLPLTY